MIKVIFEDNHILVVEKPVNIPVQKDSSKDMDFNTMVKDYLKVKYNKPGNVYLGLLHRLDRVVSGVMIFAKTSKAAQRLSDDFKNGKVYKSYVAIIDGVGLEKKGTLIDYLLKDSNTNTTKVTRDKNIGKKAILHYEVVDTVKNLTKVNIELETGRSHQIRVQFSSRGYPLYGDKKYNKNSSNQEHMGLYSHILKVYHPITKELMTFVSDEKNYYPYNLFNT